MCLSDADRDASQRGIDHFTLKAWQGKVRSEASNGRFNCVFISPQIGAFTRPQFQTSALANLDFGFRTLGGKYRFYSAIALGLAYQMQSQVLRR